LDGLGGSKGVVVFMLKVAYGDKDNFADADLSWRQPDLDARTDGLFIGMK